MPRRTAIDIEDYEPKLGDIIKPISQLLTRNGKQTGGHLTLRDLRKSRLIVVGVHKKSFTVITTGTREVFEIVTQARFRINKPLR